MAEALAFGSIVERLRVESVRLAYSSITFGEALPAGGETSASSFALGEVLHLGMQGQLLVAHDERTDTAVAAEYVYRTRHIAGHDAIHAAAALPKGAWYMVTGDDRLHRRLNGLYRDWGLPVRA